MGNDYCRDLAVFSHRMILSLPSTELSIAQTHYSEPASAKGRWHRPRGTGGSSAAPAAPEHSTWVVHSRGQAELVRNLEMKPVASSLAECPVLASGRCHVLLKGLPNTSNNPPLMWLLTLAVLSYCLL